MVFSSMQCSTISGGIPFKLVKFHAKMSLYYWSNALVLVALVYPLLHLA
jgi:hypothetical protein